MKVLGMIALTLLFSAGLAFADDTSNSQATGQGSQYGQTSDQSGNALVRKKKKEKEQANTNDQTSGGSQGSQNSQSGTGH